MSTTAASRAASFERPAVLDDTALFGHPRGLGLLFAVEMWERFSYYGMRALLVLYLVNALGWSDGDAARLYGTYTSLVWLTPLIGGYLADQFIGTRRSLVVGALVIALGHFLLALQSMTMFYLGLACVIIGTGFFKPNVSTMVGQIYRQGDDRRDAGFTIFYMGINLGAFLAPLVCGYLGQRVGWHWGFGAAGVGMLIGLVTYLIFRDRYLPGIGLAEEVKARKDAREAEARERPEMDLRSHAGPGLAGAAAGIVLAWLVAGAPGDIGGWIVNSSGWVALILGSSIGAAIAVTMLRTQGEERRRVIALFIVAFFVVFFWMAFEQAGSSMTLFADRYTNLRIGAFDMPSSWFQSVNSMFVIAFAPVFAILWRALAARRKEPSTPLKMVIGLVLLGLGFLFLVVGGRTVDACVAERGREACNVASPMWLVGAYLLHTWGELCLSPVGLSYVTKVAPWQFASLLMGVWFLAQAAAQFIGGHLAALTERIPSQSTFFSIPVATSIGAAVLMLMLVPLLKRLTSSVRA